MTRPDAAALERRLRDEAAAERSSAPPQLVPQVLAALAREPRPSARARATPSWWRILAPIAAAVAIAAMLAIGRRPEAVAPVAQVRSPTQPSVAPVEPVVPVPMLAQVRIPAPTLPDAPGAIAAPANAMAHELDRVGREADAACRFLLACVPSAPRAQR